LAAEGNRGRRAQAAILLGGAVLIAVALLIRPSSHDEGQYVAAIALMRSGWPYLDFAYLQTPLQPLLLSPLAALPAGWLLVGARAINGLFALMTAWLLLRQLRGRVAPASAAIAVATLLCTSVFLLAAAQARNDALPMLLLTAAQGALLAGLGERRKLLAHGLAGLLFGLAVSAKINAALPALGAGIYVLAEARRTGPRPLVALAAGVLAGLLPCIAAAALAPDQFRFGVFAYSLNAPTQWWTSVGKAYLLSPAIRIGKLLVLALPGVIIVGLLAAVFDGRRTPDRRLLELIIAGGIVSAYMPEPAFGHYLVPLLPAVAARFALALDGLTPSRRRLATLGAAVAALCGLVPTVGHALRARSHGIDLVRTVAAARAVAALAHGRSVVTLSPERVAGSDVAFDPRFVTGPFLFRTFGPLSADALRYGFSPNWQRLDRALDLNPPGVIVVGGETRAFPPLHPRGLDGGLEAWATARGYRPVALPGGQLTAYVRSVPSLRQSRF
jgi:4-amino-4-deoxy-L-arabinose transferase-like glycosyltransferase